MNPNRGRATLLTGATGFIGRQVALRLLQAGQTVIALARGREGRSAEQRVAAALARAAPSLRRSGGWREREFTGQIEVVDCDLAGPRRLQARALASLKGRIDTVIHCAGDTHFFPADVDLARAVSIDGALHLLDALGAHGLQRWCQISTAFVCGQRSGTVFEHERDVGQEFHNPYEEIKLLSEIALEENCRRSGIDLCILRPSIVIGDTALTQGSQPSSLFFQFIRILALLKRQAKKVAVRLRIAARPDAPFNIVPMDYLKEAILALASHPGAAPGTFHIVIAKAPAQREVLQMIIARLGMDGICLVDENIVDPTADELRLARMLAPYDAYLRQAVRFDDTKARGLLEPLGVLGAELNDLVVARWVNQALRSIDPSDSSASRDLASERLL